MNQDQVERDRLLTEVHSDVKYLVKWSDSHTKEDNERFATVYKEIEFGKKILYGGIGVVAFLEVVGKFIK